MTAGVRATASRGSPASTLLLICPVCGSDGAEPEAVVGRFEQGARASLYLRCSVCTALYQNPVPSRATNSVRGSEEAVPARLMGRWLGHPGIASLTLSRDGDVVAATGDQRYDQVVVPFLLETSPDPAAVLRAAASLLRPSGVVIVVVRNPEALAFSAFRGRHWSGYRSLDTRQVLPGRALTHLANRAQLRLLRSRSHFSPGSWLKSLRNLLHDWGAPRWLVPILAGSWPVPVAAAWVLEGVSVLFGKGSLLVATLEKP